MATRRMLHSKISLSLQVKKLPLEGQLLFTWLISHADDEGRLKGEPEYVKATVVPMKDWSFKAIEDYLNQMKKQKLIYYWKKGGRTIIQLVKWGEHQHIRSDRFKKSLLPSYIKNNDNQRYTKRKPKVHQKTAQSNISEIKIKEIKKSETNITDNPVKSLKEILSQKKILNIDSNNKDEVAALHAWKVLEPDNKIALKATYLKAVNEGVNANTIYRFVSEIKQDPTIRSPGKVFNKKVSDYCKLRRRL